MKPSPKKSLSPDADYRALVAQREKVRAARRKYMRAYRKRKKADK